VMEDQKLIQYFSPKARREQTHKRNLDVQENIKMDLKSVSQKRLLCQSVIRNCGKCNDC
jgi:hypothetical protein